MDKSYSNCPLKKRPIHVIEEEDEPEEDDEMKPVDLSATSRINIYTKQNSSERHSWNSSDRSQLSPIREESFFMDRSGSSDDQTEYTNNPDWYSKPSLPQLQRLYAPIGNDRFYDQYTQQVSPARSDPMSPHTFRESSVSPPVILGSNSKQNQYQNTVFNYNNINMKSQTGYSNTQQQSVFPYNMHSPVSDYSEPEDLSVKNKRKVVVLSDSNGNIQKSRKPKDHDTYYKCQHCVKCYSTYSGLVKHQESHAVPQDLSSHSAYNVMQTNQQTRNYDDINADQNSNSSDKRPSNLQRYQCRDCGKSYSTYSGLSKHQQFHCPAGESNQIKKFFSCKNCDKVYVSLGALKMHIRTHTLPCKCPLCGKAFSRPWLLQGHIRTHTGEKPFSCQHCHRAFADRSNLRAHLQTHSEVKKYSCSTCTKTFSRMSLLGKHLQAGCPGHTSASSPTPSNDESGIKHETNYYLSNMNAINQQQQQQQQQHHYNNTNNNNNNNIHNHNNNHPTNNDRHLNYDQHLSMIQPSHEYHAPNEIPYRDNVQVY